MRISDWSSDVCSSDLLQPRRATRRPGWLTRPFATRHEDGRRIASGAALPERGERVERRRICVETVLYRPAWDCRGDIGFPVPERGQPPGRPAVRRRADRRLFRAEEKM